jgi:glycosyltransferase involved in cell wall biosynthesis
VKLVPNAVDVEHFVRPQERPADLPPAPVATYVGSLHEDRLDVALLDELARVLPDLQIALVGPNSLDTSSDQWLRSIDNVHVLGPRPYAQIPGYLQHADVVIVPHVVTSFTDSLDPIKAYECLAVGRPTVATPVAGFRAASRPIRVVERDRFVDEVERLLASTHPTEPASAPSWAERACAFAAALAEARRVAT